MFEVLTRLKSLESSMHKIEPHCLGLTFANIGLWFLLKRQLKPDTIYVTSVLHTLSKVGQNVCTNR